MTRLTCIFLVLLRLAIGWHFFFEGLEKIQSPSWSSEAYLREASGPAAPLFRWLAGDPLLERITVLPQEHAPLPPALERDWDLYFKRFVRHYRLDDAQRGEAEKKLAQAKERSALWLIEGVKKVKSEFPTGLVVEVEKTTPQRRQEYLDKLQVAHELQDKMLPEFGPEVGAKLRAAKMEANRLRAELRKDLDEQTAAMQKALRDVLSEEQQTQESMPDPKPDWRSMSRLEWIDEITRWGLFAVGACLLAGLFTRSACLGGAAFLLAFYLAMPALPGLPEIPRSEGHYLYVNKNIIEMLALLALATTRSGRWLGLDGLLPFLNPRRWRKSESTARSASKG